MFVTWEPTINMQFGSFCSQLTKDEQLRGKDFPVHSLRDQCNVDTNPISSSKVQFPEANTFNRNGLKHHLQYFHASIQWKIHFFFLILKLDFFSSIFYNEVIRLTKRYACSKFWMGIYIYIYIYIYIFVTLYYKTVIQLWYFISSEIVENPLACGWDR